MKEKDETYNLIRRAGDTVPMNVPDGYFENLPERIQSRCVKASSPNVSFSFFQAIRAQVALGFGFIALAAIAYTGYQFLYPNSNDYLNGSDEFVSIVHKQISDFDIAGYNGQSQGSNIINPDDYNEEVIRYLLDDRVDFVTLMEAYHIDENP